VHFDIVVDFGDLSSQVILRRAVIYFAWLLLAVGLAAVIGLLPAMFFFLVAFMRVLGEQNWARTLTVAVAVWVFCYVLFRQVLFVPWPQSLIGDWFPVLRSNIPTNLF
jgi:ATP/ADP translocase